MMNTPRVIWLIALAAAGLTVLAIVYLIDRFPEAMDGDGKISLVHGLVVLAFLGGSAILYHRRTPPGLFLRSVLAWMAIAVVVFTGYSYRFELANFKDRLLGELMPSSGIEVSGGAVSIRADQSGHFVVEAMVVLRGASGSLDSGVPIRFLVDTGASDVVLSPRDAERLGLNVNALDYTRAYRTANGMVKGAPVRLNRISIGPLSLAEVRASVNGVPMSRSLLGMSFLSRLSGYEVSRERMVLHP